MCPYCYAKNYKEGHVEACAASTSVRPPFPRFDERTGKTKKEDDD